MGNLSNFAIQKRDVNVPVRRRGNQWQLMQYNELQSGIENGTGENYQCDQYHGGGVEQRIDRMLACEIKSWFLHSRRVLKTGIYRVLK